LFRLQAYLNMVLKWLGAIFASSLTFALADILCDVCISEKEQSSSNVADGSGEGEKMVQSAADDDDDVTVVLSHTPNTLDDGSSDSETGGNLRQRDGLNGALADAEPGLTGEQDTAIAGMVTVAGLLVSAVYWVATGVSEWHSMAEGATLELKGMPKLRWGPLTHLQFWLAMLGGSMAFLHYYFLLKAFEGAPSTVLLPLVQVASVSVLFGSSIVALLRNEPWITPVHTLAYVLMFIGGILPACGGQLSALLQRSFWNQGFVSFAIMAEFALGLHDLMLSGCAYHAERSPDDPAPAPTPGSEDDAVESFEFFVWSRCSFVATFIGMFTFFPKLNSELRDLFSGRVPTRFIWLSALSEGLTVLGFYLASIAYGLFYQAGIVHAAEASLSQLLNLSLAYVLLELFGVGRSSSVGSMPAKVVSFIMVSVGLFLCTFEDAPPALKKTVAAGPLLEMQPFLDESTT